jgi:Mg2+/citrate symporter
VDGHELGDTQEICGVGVSGMGVGWGECVGVLVGVFVGVLVGVFVGVLPGTGEAGDDVPRIIVTVVPGVMLGWGDALGTLVTVPPLLPDVDTVFVNCWPAIDCSVLMLL